MEETTEDGLPIFKKPTSTTEDGLPIFKKKDGTTSSSVSTTPVQQDVQPLEKTGWEKHIEELSGVKQVAESKPLNFTNLATTPTFAGVTTTTGQGNVSPDLGVANINGQQISTGGSNVIDYNQEQIVKDAPAVAEAARVAENQRLTKLNTLLNGKTPGEFAHDQSLENLGHLNVYNTNQNILKQLIENPNIKQYGILMEAYKTQKDPAVKEAIKKQIDDLTARPLDEPKSFAEGLADIKTVPIADEHYPWPKNKVAPPSYPELEKLKGGTVADAIGVMKEATAKANAAKVKLAAGQADLDAIVSEERKRSGFEVGSKGYKELNPLQSFFNGLGTTLEASINGLDIMTNSYTPEQKIQKYKEAIGNEQVIEPQKPASVIGDIAQAGGSVLPYFAGGLGAEAGVTNTVGNMMVNSTLMGTSGIWNGGVQAFAESKAQGDDDMAALKKADAMSVTGGASGVVTGSLLSLMPHGGEYTGMQDFLAQTTVKNAGIGTMFGLEKYVDNKIAQSIGLKREDDAGVADAFKGAMTMGALLDGVVYGSKTLPPKVRDVYANTIAKYGFVPASDAIEKAKLDGSLDPITAAKVQDELTKKAAAFNAMPPDLSPKIQVAILPDVMALHEAAAELKKAKENNMPTEAIDAKIETLQNTINEKTGAPLTIDEQHELHDLIQRKNEAGDPESKSEPLSKPEKERLKHLEAREEAAKGNEAAKVEAKQKNTEAVKNLAQRIANGENITAPEDLQLQANNGQELEAELKKLAKKNPADKKLETGQQYEVGDVVDLTPENTTTDAGQNTTPGNGELGAKETPAAGLEQVQQGAPDVTEATTQVKPVQENTGNVEPPVEQAGVTETEGPSITSIKNAKVDEERKARGLEPAMEVGRKTFGATWDEAMANIDENPDAGRKLVEELKNKSRPLSDMEDAILLHEQVDAQNQYGKITEAINKAAEAGDDAAVEENRVRLAEVSDRLQDIYDAGKAAGTANARGLNARKMMAKEDFSLAAMETAKRAANDGKPLDPKVKAEIEGLHKKLQDAQKAFDDYVAKNEERLSAMEGERVVRTLKEDSKKQKRATTKLELKQERKQIVEGIKGKLGDIAAKIAEKGGGKLNAVEGEPLDKDMLKALSSDITKLAKNYIQEGVLNLADLVDNIHDDLKDFIPGITKRNVRDAISGYGLEGEPRTREQLQKDLDAVKSEARKLSKAEDIASGAKEDPRLTAKKTRLENQQKELEDKIANGDYSKKPRTPIAPDRKAMELMANIERLKKQFWEGLEKDRLSKRSKLEKGLDLAVKVERAFKLSSVTVLGKLAAAALTRMATSPIEEGIGGVLSKVLPNLASRAPREGGVSVKAEARALTQGFVQGVQDAGKILKTGKSTLDALLGKKGLPAEALDFFGSLHSMLKAPAKRNEFERSFQKRSEFYMKQGVDVSDPIVQTQIATEAYKDANRAIFLQDNIASDAYKVAMNYLEHKGATGQVSAAFLKILMPFVKVPTNVIAEAGQHITGIPVGAAKLAMAVKKGMENLPPEQADIIMRNFKKGSFGLGLLALGYFNHKAFGGFFHKGDKREDTKLKPGDTELFGVKIPGWLQHAPALQVLQYGGDAGRMADAFDASTNGKKGLGSAIFGSTLGLVEETPFTREMLDMGKVFESENSAKAFIGELVKNTVDPAILQQIARWTDDADRRYPNDKEGWLKAIKEHIESGLPVLNKNIMNSEENAVFNKQHSKQVRHNNKQHKRELNN